VGLEVPGLAFRFLGGLEGLAEDRAADLEPVAAFFRGARFFEAPEPDFAFFFAIFLVLCGLRWIEQCSSDCGVATAIIEILAAVPQIMTPNALGPKGAIRLIDCGSEHPAQPLILQATISPEVHR